LGFSFGLFTRNDVRDTSSIALSNKTSYWASVGTNFTTTDPDVDNITKSPLGIIQADADGITFICPINLPQGAVIKTAKSSGNAGAQAETWTLYKYPIPTGALASIATDNFSTGVTAINETVDNQNFAYFFVSSTLDTNDQIYSAEISYTTNYD
jgi:hypothetical protein